MASIDAEDKQVLWMNQLGVHLHPQETVGTLAFSSKGKRKINHLTWSEVISLELVYERLDEIENHLVARMDVHEPE